MIERAVATYSKYQFSMQMDPRPGDDVLRLAFKLERLVETQRQSASQGRRELFTSATQPPVSAALRFLALNCAYNDHPSSLSGLPRVRR